MTENLFAIWLKEHFATYTNASVEISADVIMITVHNTHQELCLFCKMKGILNILIPSHTSHRVQTIYLTLYDPLKSALNKDCDIFLKYNASRKITAYA
jgi:hypothetical protein